MAKGTFVLSLLALSVVGQALTPTTYITPSDQQRLLNLFKSASPYQDLETLHYSVLGITLLGKKLEAADKTCDVIKKSVDAANIESLFYASSAAKTLKGNGNFDCKFPTGDAQKLLDGAITEDAPALTIYYAVAAMHNLGFKIDAAKVTTALNAALKTDDGPLSHGYAFYAASYLSGDLTKFHDLIEDVVAQADEVEEMYLQFEGGVYTTAIVVDSAYKLAAAAKKPPVLTEDRVIKFANYLLSRKHVQSVKNAAAVLSAVKTLTDNKFHIPVAVTLASQITVSDKEPVVQVRVSNLMGESLGKGTLTADTARHLSDDAVVLSKKAFTPNTKDDSLYEIDLMKVNPARGFYRLTMSMVPQKADARFIGTSGADVEVKVTTRVSIEGVAIGVADKEQSTASKTTKLQHPNKAASPLEADYHQKVSLKFQLIDQLDKKPMAAHQTFIKMTNKETKQDIIFVAEPDSSNMYRFELDVGENAQQFRHLSGKYMMTLIVGDAVLQNSLTWDLADVHLTFPEGSASTDVVFDRYGKRPEIKHMFREPEKRPPAVLSNIFTVLVLVPLLVLLLLWMKIGVNMKNFPFSISALGFHLGLAGIFVLYYFYWVQLNMFDTLRYLGFLGVPTFLLGNSLLSRIAAKRMKKGI